METLVYSLETWMRGTAASDFMRETWWAWRAAESLHFIGLTLLLGTVGIFDLSLAGLVKRVPLLELHRLIPWGILGFAINITTGALFLAGYPDQYFYNAAFHFKLLFMALAGANVLVFYLLAYAKLRRLGPEDATPPVARTIGMISLVLWIGVVTCGRLLTFYRP